MHCQLGSADYEYLHELQLGTNLSDIERWHSLNLRWKKTNVDATVDDDGHELGQHERGGRNLPGPTRSKLSRIEGMSSLSITK